MNAYDLSGEQYTTMSIQSGRTLIIYSCSVCHQFHQAFEGDLLACIYSGGVAQ